MVYNATLLGGLAHGEVDHNFGKSRITLRLHENSSLLSEPKYELSTSSTFHKERTHDRKPHN